MLDGMRAWSVIQRTIQWVLGLFRAAEWLVLERDRLAFGPRDACVTAHARERVRLASLTSKSCSAPHTHLEHPSHPDQALTMTTSVAPLTLVLKTRPRPWRGMSEFSDTRSSWELL